MELVIQCRNLFMKDSVPHNETALICGHDVISHDVERPCHSSFHHLVTEAEPATYSTLHTHGKTMMKVSERSHIRPRLYIFYGHLLSSQALGSYQGSSPVVGSYWVTGPESRLQIRSPSPGHHPRRSLWLDKQPKLGSDTAV